MALSIMNNSTAIGAMGKLNVANSALSKTISQLSSGLRINSAADDASGLAVSEKLRGQIKGLSKAASNAQDAISLLQTAEASMGSMTDIIQRMRELAVQAGDPAYTTNDRAMLQLEVDQLKSEIDRISTSTEFNTKKLLNGDAAGVWSSSSANLEAIIKGSPAEGNYEITTDVVVGQAYTYKSGIMNVNDAFGTAIFANGDTTAAGIRGINTRNMLETAGFTFGLAAGNGAAITSALDSLGTKGTFAGDALGVTSISATGAGYLQIEALKDFTGGVTADAIRITFTYASSGKTFSGIFGLEADGSLTAGASISGGVTLNVAAIFYTSAKKGAVMTHAKTQGVAASATTADTTLTLGALEIRDVAGSLNADKPTTRSYTTAQWDAGLGQLVLGKMDITYEAATAFSTVTATTLDIKSGGVANSATKLGSLSNFTNSDGRNVLANAQNISIYANGQSFDISVEGSDTVRDLLDKLNGAFETLGLGTNIAQFVTAPAGGGDDAVQGTFVINSDMLNGDASKISFVGDQNVLNGLGVNTIKEGINNTITATVKDAHTGEVLSSKGKDLTVTDGIIRNVIQGVDVKITTIVPAGTTAGATLAAHETAFLHIKNTATNAAIGPNEGQTLDISIGRMDTVALGIDSIVVATFDDAQKSITKLDMAMETLSKARATTGAQMNRLDYTINNLNTMRENLTAAESRLRDLDIAQASSDLTAQQVRLQAATAMLAQANQMPSYAAQLLQ